MLGHARVIYLDHVRLLLNWLDPAKSELAYMVSASLDSFELGGIVDSARFQDTDSVVVYAKSGQLVDCVKEDQLEEFQRRFYDVFEKPGATEVQACKLKVEGLYSEG